MKKLILIIFSIVTLGLALGAGRMPVFAQASPSVLYVPLIGITSVPQPLALPNGPGKVIYNYAVKNFIKEIPLTNIQVVDDNCMPVTFTGGDDNSDNKLDYGETWRYQCSTNVSQTTQSTATATGTANNITTTHTAFSTVVVGAAKPPPLVSIVNITKVAYPLSLPPSGGSITYTYKVGNPGIIPLEKVTVTDDKCSAMSGRLGDTNGNGLLDPSEVWIFTCTTKLTQTTVNTATVTAFGNGLRATGTATITVKVENPNFPDVGTKPVVTINPNFKIIVWGILLAALIILATFSILLRKKIIKKNRKKRL